MKLDFTGVQYIKEYKEKLSQEFKKKIDMKMRLGLQEAVPLLDFSVQLVGSVS